MAGKRKAGPAKGKSRAGRPPVVEGRPDRDEIFAALMVQRPNYTEISRNRGVSVEALKAFEGRWIPPNVRQMLDDIVDKSQVLAAQLDFIAEGTEMFRTGKLLMDGCYRWLQDPEDPTRFTVAPRDYEVAVVWERLVENGSGKAMKEKHIDKLSDLLRECRAGNPCRAPEVEEIAVVEVKHGDPRELVPKLISATKPLIEMLGKALGQIASEPGTQVNVFLGSPDWQRIEDAIAAAVEGCARCPGAIDAALERVKGIRGA